MNHVSPNGAEPGSFAHAAEAWALSQGMSIPDEQRFPHMYRGMLDDFSESDASVDFDR